MKGNFYIEKNNKKVKCDILYTFNYNDENYIIYNDGSIDEIGYLNVLANKFIINDDKITLLDIDDYDWNIIDKVWSDING